MVVSFQNLQQFSDAEDIMYAADLRCGYDLTVATLFRGCMFMKEVSASDIPPTNLQA